MYNGIGLQTARGSGTNGYVQSNKFFIKAKANSVSLQPPSTSLPDLGAKKANKEILEHDRKRRIELRLVVLEETLADQGYTQAEIAEKLRETRAALETAPLDNPPEKRISDTQTHQIAARKEKQLETFRAALGIKLGDESPKHDTEEQKHQDKAQGLETEESGGEKDREEKKLTDGKQDHGDKEREGSKKARATEEHRSKNDLHDKKNREKKANEVEHKKMDTKKGRYKDVSASDSSGEDVKNDKMKPSRNTRGLDSRYDTDIRSSKKSSKVFEKDKISSYLDSNEDSDSSSESGGEKTRKSRKVAKQRKYDSDSGTDGGNKRKRGHVKERPSSGRRYDHDESDSGHDSGRENTRKLNKNVKQQRRYDNASKIDEDAKKKKGHAKELPSRRRRDSDESDSDSDFSMDDTRKSRKVVKKQRRYDSSSETDEDDGRKKAHVNETSRKRRHDSDDSDSASDDSGSGKGRTSKHYNDKRNKNDSETVQEKKITKNKKILEKSRRHDSGDSSSGADDTESHSSDSISDGDSSDASDFSGYKRIDDKNGKRLKSIVEKDLSSGVSRRDDRRTSKITNEDRNRDHSSLLKKSEKNRHVEMKNDRKEVGDKENQAAQGKRKIDDGRDDDLPVLESRNSGLGKSEKMKESVEAKKDGYNRDHRTHHERRDNQKRDDYKYHGNSQKHYDEDDYGRRHKSRDDRSHNDPKRRKLESSRQYARSSRYESDSGEDAKSHRRR